MKDYESFTTARECCEAARALWLSARSNEDLQIVERLYVRAIRSYTQQQQQQQQSSKPPSISPSAPKKIKTGPAKTTLEPFTTREEYEAAGERLALLMCQSGRANSIAKALRSLGFTCRLSTVVLDYPLESSSTPQSTSTVSTINCRNISDPPSSSLSLSSSSAHPPTSCYNETNPPCIVLDDFLNNSMFQFLQKVFQDPTSSYWTDHHYQLEPPSPYFSYVIPLLSPNNDHNHNHNDTKVAPVETTTTASTMSRVMVVPHDMGGLGDIINSIYTSPELRAKFPRLEKARFVELWAHNRPHASGHQLHFDSDDEGRGDGGPRHPIVSTVLYLSSSSSSSNDHDVHDNSSMSNNRDDHDEDDHHEDDNHDDDHVKDCAVCCGGPSLVTCQTLTDKSLASYGWLCHPKPRRLVAFDGAVLHGVIPGKGVAPSSSSTNTTFMSGKEQQDDIGHHRRRQRQRRVTCMLAFWQDLAVRDKETTTPGSARPFPTASSCCTSSSSSSCTSQQHQQQPQWVSDLCQPLLLPPTASVDVMDGHKNASHPHQSLPTFVDCIYETLQGQPWSKEMGFPDYNQIFQGF